jgi:hypothetical protein
MGAFTQQIEIEIGQDRRKAIGIVEIDDGLAESRAQLVPLRAVRQGAREQAGIVNPRQRRGLAMLADRIDLRRLGQESAHHGSVALFVQAEIAKGFGVAAFNDGIGLRG